jgi:NADPH:quinone reductase-like Zn-dependent oxidoreductase
MQSYDELKVVEVPEPRQKDDELLISTSASGLNFVDLLYVCWIILLDRL